MQQLGRRGFLAGAAACLLRPGRVAAQEGALGLGYLEALAAEGALAPGMAYLPPSALHPAYSHAFYVNASHSGPGMQKLWAIARDGSGWRLALHDAAYWEARGEAPQWSWPVSTGVQRAGNPPYILTPPGIYNVDERRARQYMGWGSPGMYAPVYIDYHYASGRISSVALHGTDRINYRHLGERASHGCVRMTQENASQIRDLLHPGRAVGADSPLWGEVPRYFRSTPRDSLAARTGYVRDGSLLVDEAGQVLTKMGYRALIVIFRDDL